MKQDIRTQSIRNAETRTHGHTPIPLTLTSSLASDGLVVDFDTVTGQLGADAAMEETTEEGEDPLR